MESNKIQNKQLAILAFIMSITFKVVMLPKYLNSYASTQSYMVVGIVMLFELFTFAGIYSLITKTSLTEIKCSKFIMAPIVLMIGLTSFFKLTVLMSETITYTANTLFDQGISLFILIAFLPALAYLSYKGGNNIGRICQFIFWFILIATVYNTVFAKVDLYFDNILPILPNGFNVILKGVDKHFLWFGDFTPLLFFRVVKKNEGKKYIFISLITIYLLTVFFYILFSAIYGNSGNMIANAFSSIASYNKFSQMIGRTEFPIICAWTIMAIIKLSVLTYSSLESINFVIKNRYISLGIVIFALFFLSQMQLNNSDKGYNFGISWVRYPIMIVEYVFPWIIYLIYKITHKKTKTISIKFSSPQTTFHREKISTNRAKIISKTGGAK